MHRRVLYSFLIVPDNPGPSEQMLFSLPRWMAGAVRLMEACCRASASSFAPEEGHVLPLQIVPIALRRRFLFALAFTSNTGGGLRRAAVAPWSLHITAPASYTASPITILRRWCSLSREGLPQGRVARAADEALPHGHEDPLCTPPYNYLVPTRPYKPAA